MFCEETAFTNLSENIHYLLIISNIRIWVWKNFAEQKFAKDYYFFMIDMSLSGARKETEAEEEGKRKWKLQTNICKVSLRQSTRTGPRTQHQPHVYPVRFQFTFISPKRILYFFSVEREKCCLKPPRPVGIHYSFAIGRKKKEVKRSVNKSARER